ncbi:hypothetical protein TNCV_2969141 [Trichonephila clavipes]|nr:hypothetical protein TNCV_2969141 [Trichonephila clavipes]
MEERFAFHFPSDDQRPATRKDRKKTWRERVREKRPGEREREKDRRKDRNPRERVKKTRNAGGIEHEYMN